MGDRLVQSQRCLLGRRGTEKEGVAGDRTGVIIQQDGQPRSGRSAGLVEDRDVEERVICLPLLVRAGYAGRDRWQRCGLGSSRVAWSPLASHSGRNEG